MSNKLLRPEKMRCDEIFEHVRSDRNGHDEEVPYDVNGVIHLVLAAPDNLRDHWFEGDFDQIRAATLPEQRAHFIQIGRFLEDHAADANDIVDAPSWRDSRLIGRTLGAAASPRRISHQRRRPCQ